MLLFCKEIANYIFTSIGWGTLLQTGNSRVRYQTRWMSFLNLPNPSGRTRPWGSPSIWWKWVPESEESRFWRVKCGRRVKLINASPSVSPLSRQCRIPNVSQSYRPPRAVTMIALLTSCFNCTAYLKVRTTISRRSRKVINTYACLTPDTNTTYDPVEFMWNVALNFTST
jgi:hypothetical protein